MTKEQLPQASAPKPEKKFKGLSRRELLLGGGAAVASAGSIATGAAIGEYLAEKTWDEPQPAPHEHPHTEDKAHPESKEAIRQHEPSEVFNQKIAGFETLYGKIHRDEMLFVDGNGAPIETVKIAPVDGLLPGKHKDDRRLQFDQHGLLIGDPNPEWVEYERTLVRNKNPGFKYDTDKQLPHGLHVLHQIRDAIENEDDPFVDPEPQTYLEVVQYFGAKEVVGGGGLSRIAYVRKHGMEGMDDLPLVLTAELNKFLPGIAAQESHFNNASKSGKGAQGIFQFMPSTWHDLGHTPEDILSLSQQVQAASEHLRSSYREMNAFSLSHGNFLARIKAEYFNGDEDAYLRYFIAPMVINSYNPGADRLLQLAQWFEQYLATTKAERTHESYPHGYGYDLFNQMTTEVHDHPLDPQYPLLEEYGSESSEYFPRVYAFAELLD
jgi:hypothetical protein